MEKAIAVSKNSKDPHTKVGACIVNPDNKQIVATGFNDFPMHDSGYSWEKEPNSLNNKHLYVVHAEVDAIIKNSMDVKGCMLYVTLFPCNECAKIIAHSRIKEVIYFSDEKKDKLGTEASKKILKKAGIPYQQYEPKNKKIKIDL